jgi:Transcription factor WhiB
VTGLPRRTYPYLAAAKVSAAQVVELIEMPLYQSERQVLPEGGHLPADLQLAKAYCQPCPMRRICLAGAVERYEPHGVWGGEIFARGAIISEKRPRGRPPSKLRPVSELVHAGWSPALR